MEKCRGLSVKRKSLYSSSKPIQDKSIVERKRRSKSTESLVSLISATDNRSKTPLETSRSGMLNSKRLQRREVDMPAKQQMIREQLTQAIKGIVKPNRAAHKDAFLDTIDAKKKMLAPSKG